MLCDKGEGLKGRDLLFDEWVLLLQVVPGGVKVIHVNFKIFLLGKTKTAIHRDSIL